MSEHVTLPNEPETIITHSTTSLSLVVGHGNTHEGMGEDLLDSHWPVDSIERPTASVAY